MFLEMLTVLLAQMAAVIGMPAAILVLVGSAVLAMALCYKVAGGLAEMVMGPSHIMYSTEVKKSEIEKMNDAALSKKLDRSPRNADAVKEHCKRLKQKGDTEGYARELEHYLKLKTDIDLEERCMLHHQLADLYLGPLNRPTEAERVLKDFITNHTRSKQADFMKERLTRMVAMKAEG